MQTARQGTRASLVKPGREELKMCEDDLAIDAFAMLIELIADGRDLTNSDVMETVGDSRVW